MEQIIALYFLKLQETTTTFFRYLYDEIDWSDRLIVIKGSKGVGKTTLVLQHIKECFPDPSKALYISLDHIWFSNHTLLELAEYFYSHGGTHIFIDEVHKYPNWEREVKNIYDFYTGMNIVVTGSSMLQIEKSVKADLSRRARVYELRGLSFREYLKFKYSVDLPILNLEEIIAKHSLIASDIASKEKILPLFEEYLKHGFYPFSESGTGYEERILQVIDNIVSVEIPAVGNIEYATTYKIKRFLSALATEAPFVLNISSLCNILDSNRNSLLKIMELAEQARIIRKIYSGDCFANLSKPEKILFDNPNIIYAFGNANTGTVRECFFASQITKGHEIFMPKSGDFIVDNKYTIEVGGPNKKFGQIKDLPNSFIAADGMEVGAYSKIPLWLFGMLY